LRGHPLASENCYTTAPGRRVCRPCARTRATERHDRIRRALAAEGRP
jgi:hypothetical protein